MPFTRGVNMPDTRQPQSATLAAALRFGASAGGRNPKSKIPNPKSEIGYNFCTYFDRNYLTRGLALHTSLVRHCQRPFILWILCFDDETYAILARLDLPGVRLISQQEFEAGDEELARAKATRSRVEYYWTCTPSLPCYVLRHNPEVDLITYLDADLYFYSDPQPIYEELGAGSILIVEHRYAPEYAHFAATSGIYNVGVMAFRQDARGLACLSWWRERCLEWCYTRFEDGKYGDQMYLDDWPERFRGVVVSEHAGAGLAPWNLTRYRVKSGDDGITVDGQPLIFYHCHGYKLASRHTAEPADYAYRISAEVAKLLYLPYAHALQDTQRQIDASLGRPVPLTLPAGDASVGIARQLLAQRLLLVTPAWLALLLWRIGGWRRDNWAIQEAGFRAHAAGDLQTARHHFLTAIRRNPLVLRNLGIISILLESVVGSGRMARYRAWRAQLRPKRNATNMDGSSFRQ